MDQKTMPKEAACCGAATCAQAAPNPAFASPEGLGRRFYIATMDCSVEEAEIRRALERVAGIRRLSFQLSARTLTVNAQQEAFPAVLEAIRKAGFTPEPVDVDSGAQARTRDDHANHHAHDHHTHEMNGGMARLALALVLAIAAEATSWFGAQTMPWKLLGMGLALAAIWLAGVDV
jgi:Zn2+/Cd2+-exporting ATPase